ncbi:uncharacterized protein MELLADRAFT_78896 [Melampsora larici-populina 98AG31]|uniref:UBX domain-containing protein n=1 Tax=Melampsora larici-populina (strain 98AG31 / pathotype 3-4-7) TaxID=747676 RepID=F4S088_MELLP|nr:uncharacterized protein MELLADRAFT_78896 [Melampsora larici-populina 98AG31]EGG01916.1 hypothetical protein MELLADRAFT_78896 [Melampsora larici-populina 98AG31]
MDGHSAQTLQSSEIPSEQPQVEEVKMEPTSNTTSSSSPNVNPPSSQPTANDTPKHQATDIKVWRPSADARPPPRPELSDQYFVPTAAEAQRAFSGQVATRERLTDAPMLTKSLRDREAMAKKNERYSRFPITRIRIRFSNRTMLEGAFQSQSTMRVVYAFVKASLVEDVRSQAFILYQTPPRREFKLTDPAISTKTLLELQLTPSSLFYIKFTDEALNQTQRVPPLLPDLLAQAQDLPPPPNLDQDNPSNPSAVTNAIDKGKQKLDDVLKSGAKAPKWLQNLKKK